MKAGAVSLCLCLTILWSAHLAAQQGVGKQDPVPPSDTAHLRFAWPAGLSARVSAHKVRARLSDGKADTTNVRMSYQLSVEPHARGRLVRFHDFEVPGAPRLEELEQRATALMPSLIVDTSGEFLSVVDVEAMRRELDAVLGPAGRNPLIERFRSAGMLNALAANEWNALVGTWIDSDLGIGLTYSADYDIPFPLFPGVMLGVTQEFTALGRVPCTPTESARRCVELESTVYPDEDALGALLKRMMSEVVPSDTIKMPTIEDYEFENTIHLIAEPGTLIPHLLEVSKRFTMRMKSHDGPPEEASQVETKTTRYVYPARRP